MLHAILIVTIMSLDLAASEAAYRQHLGYRTAEHGTLPTVLASAWGTPAMRGRDYVLMRPAQGRAVYLRFVATKDIGNYAPMRTEGWNAVEILVRQPDALARRLADSPFQVIGPPAFLSERRNTRAFQALGPNDELLYFTRVLDLERASFDLDHAEAEVGRTFIMVLGGRSMPDMRRFYGETLGATLAGPVHYRVTVLSRAYGQPEDREYPLSIAQLPSRSLIEFDEYPAQAASRRRAPSELPPGIAMVAFEVCRLDRLASRLLSRPAAVARMPYRGRRVAATRGPAGEWLEFVETDAACPMPGADGSKASQARPGIDRDG